MTTIDISARGWRLNRAIVFLSLIAPSVGCLVAQPRQERPAVKKNAVVQPATSKSGERKFQENCSRCHSAPEQLSPRITGTIVRHMRVRASLSAEDAQDILRYLSP